MSMIYLTQAMWEEHAADRQLCCAVGENRPCPRPEDADGVAQEDKVVDMAAWKAENLVELDEPEERASGLAQYEGRELVRRPRRRHERARVRAELAATALVAVLMLALVIRVLVF